MNTTPQEGVALSQSICRTVGDSEVVDVVLCPPFTSLIAVFGVVHHTPVMLGAQNVNQHANGAYTGEVSAGMLQGLVSHVIVGHSERRQTFGETGPNGVCKGCGGGRCWNDCDTVRRGGRCRETP